MSCLRDNKAFSLTELLTTVGIVGTLAVIGIKSYQKQTNQAKAAEAKKSLSFVYAAQKNFYTNWGGYHENLAAVGAVPVGNYIYDIGFGKNTALASNYGSLGSYPTVDGDNILDVRKCTSFQQICDGDCMNQIKAGLSTSYQTYYSGSADCKVLSKKLLKNYTGAQSTTVNNAGAAQNSFTVIAVTQLKNVDIWSIDQASAVTHVNDGIQ